MGSLPPSPAITQEIASVAKPRSASSKASWSSRRVAAGGVSARPEGGIPRAAAQGKPLPLYRGPDRGRSGAIPNAVGRPDATGLRDDGATVLERNGGTRDPRHAAAGDPRGIPA